MPNDERRTRPDRSREVIVAAGIAMAGIDGRAAAARFLERERVPFSVIVRVLAEPGRRRRSVAHPPHDCKCRTDL